MITLRPGRSAVVIGGGISGLAAAFELQRLGIRVRVLERNDRPGGLIHSQWVDGYLLEWAATCIFNFLPEVDFFCRNLGLDREMVFRQEVAKRRYLVRDGRPTPVPLHAGGFIGTPLVSLKGKMRLLLEPFIPRGPVAEGQETVAQFISRRFGREIYERAIEPYVSGTLAGDGERACLRSTFTQFAALEEEYGSILKGAFLRKIRGIRTASCGARVFSFRQGMAALPDAIAGHLGEGFRPGRTVEGLERQGTRWRVTARGPGDGLERYEADAVLVATPAWEAARLLEELSPNLGLLLAGVQYSPMAITHLGFERRQITHDLDGIGCLVPKREPGFDLLGSLWPSTLFAGRAPEGEALFMNYLGGARQPDRVDEADEALIDRSLTDLGRLTGLKGEPRMARVVRHDRALPQYPIGHRLFVEGVAEQMKLLPGVFLTGNYLDGVSVRACIARGGETAKKMATLMNRSAYPFGRSSVFHSSGDRRSG